MAAGKPKILVMGENGGMEEIDWDELPEPTDAVELADYFKKVRISPQAIDQVSKIVPSKYYEKEGLYTWISRRAEFIFGKLSTSETSGKLKQLKYDFVFDAHGPVLDRVTFLP